MSKRITRTLCQIGGLTTLVLILVFIADSRYRVLPNSLHSHLPSHHTGSVITDLTVSFCSSANPFSKCRLDPEKWHRVEKDLYLNAGWLGSAWVHVKRKKEEDLLPEDRVVVGVRVGRSDPGFSVSASDEEEPWERRPGGIWIQRSAKRHDSDSDRAVTAVDVLFGPDAVDPRPGWYLAQLPLEVDSGQAVRLTVRHGQHKTHDKDVAPRVSKDGRFKILQVSDAHLSTGVGKCRDPMGPNGPESVSSCEADPRTLEFLESVLDDEKPSLVIFSGDQVEGPTAPDTQTTLLKLAAPLISRGIPYACIFGNHDDEGSLSMSRPAQMALLQTLPYSLSQPGPEHIEGTGNYYIEVLAPSPSTHKAVTIYMLDTHGLTPDEKRYKGYDWLKQSQIEWFRTTSEGLKKSHQKYSHIHMDMAFIHIPLPEFGSEENKIWGGSWKEKVTAPIYNSQFYDALADEGVVAVGCGHDHANDYCALRPAEQNANSPHARPHHGPWMCYAGGSGFGGYGGYGGFQRRVRVWEVDTNAGRMMTWKRVECCGDDTKKKIDEFVLVEGGHVVGPPG